MKKTFIIILSIAVFTFLILTAFVFFQFSNSSRLILASMSGNLPGPAHLTRIRENLLGQENFRTMLIKHEKAALNQFRKTGKKTFTKKYIYKTPTSMFDIKTFHDYWETWVVTDISDGKPLTSFLVRLGIIKDKNAESFFSNQCESGACVFLMKTLISTYNRMFDWGILKAFRLNITESDITSSTSRVRLSTEDWNIMVKKIHANGQGITFTKL